ncbi:DUF2489 domain-containing protein [Litorilituus lipolyticus]|uniref:DUF2489 domain-containing protein n=1 Tax=Litorilituus lipolyticus TaxID=2491017 RepID=A0A502KTQ7_9GAMM|nr:DUF2489 domain-containing protein [Litorilituus lipolyticus]TPH13471.1 DUF2489 domain-containing protein [Litorilituus lipolyticus]
MDNNWIIALVLALVVIVPLAFYAGSLLKQLARQNALEQEAIAAKLQAHQTHDKKIFDSVIIIARAMEEEQCDFSEGCWRLSVLLDSLKLSSELNQKFPAIFELYNEIKELSILEDRKQLAKKQRMKEDYQRITAEAKLRDQIAVEIKSVHQFASEQITSFSL